MTYKVCYWDTATRTQMERDATPEEVAEIEERKLPKPPPVPASVPLAHARIVLRRAGISAQMVNDAIAAMEDADARADAMDLWEYGSVVRRDSPFVAALAPTLNLTEQQVDALFVAAGAL